MEWAPCHFKGPYKTEAERQRGREAGRRQKGRDREDKITTEAEIGVKQHEARNFQKPAGAGRND